MFEKEVIWEIYVAGVVHVFITDVVWQYVNKVDYDDCLYGYEEINVSQSYISRRFTCKLIRFSGLFEYNLCHT